MTHAESCLLLTDLALGRLDGERAGAVRAHAAGCAECGESLTFIDSLRELVAEHGEALFAEHPTAAALVAWAASPADLTTPDLARIGLHAKICPACRAEAAATRAAAGEAASGRGAARAPAGGLGAWLRTLGLMRPAPALAALLVVALLWPAWIGLRGGRSDGVPPATPADIRALYLPPATRSPADVPAIALRPGQTLLPLVIPIDPWAGRTDTADFPLTFTVTDAAEDRLLWTLTTPASAAWDERGRFVSVAVDGTKLVRGACLLRVAGPDGAVLMEGRFEVR